MEIKVVSVDAVMLYFEQNICEEVLDQVQAHYVALKELKGIIDITPSYCSILVQYDIFVYDYKSIQNAIHKTCSKAVGLALANAKKQSKLIKIPTNYKNNLDLERVAKHNHLSIKEVIQLHSQRTYRVYAIGFIVGFAYLAKVNSKIMTPRLESPRHKVSKGSVAIADNQTAIYPQNSAGGWNIIGHTDFDEFQSFEVGDRVAFIQI